MEPPKITCTQLYIGGKFVNSQNNATLDVFNPSTAKKIGEVQCGGKEDIDLAVKAALEAKPKWEKVGHEKKADLFQQLANEVNKSKTYQKLNINQVQKNKDDLMLLEALDTGIPMHECGDFIDELVKGPGDADH